MRFALVNLISNTCPDYHEIKIRIYLYAFVVKNLLT
jgi:hypothetical protein